jgi:type II secretory ATPase GspE/PulE/Tfp pilus assembly ATPase PilB-like protein
MAQRLVRVLCEECKQEDTSDRVNALKKRIEVLRDTKIYKATGCRNCRMTGYTGRHALFELMTMSPAVREILLRNGSSIEIKDAARREGMRTLLEDGWRLVDEGITTPSEVLRVSKDEDAAYATE